VQQLLDGLIFSWLAKKAEKILKKAVFNEHRKFLGGERRLIVFFSPFLELSSAFLKLVQ